jgi:hypothetical protein
MSSLMLGRPRTIPHPSVIEVDSLDLDSRKGALRNSAARRRLVLRTMVGEDWAVGSNA